MTKIKTYLVVVLVAALSVQLAHAQEEEIAAAPESNRDACPATMDITYAIYSDYIFRGINFSEYAGEGREKLNHQITTNIGLDLGMLFGQERGDFGTLSFGTFWEWYADQEILNPNGGAQNLQETDFSISWAYEFEPIHTTMTLGYVFFTYPNAKPLNTHEWTIGLEHNDAWMWRWLWPDNEDGVLNPTFFFAQDVDEIKGCWAEFGISHGFEIFEGMTLTPSALLALDHRYLDPAVGLDPAGSTRLAYVQYGITAEYDLSTLGTLPQDPGTWTLSWFLHFNQALGNPKDSGAIDDELFGGIAIGWSF